jgi:hypothetical protein
VITVAQGIAGADSRGKRSSLAGYIVKKDNEFADDFWD